ncbi:MAG: hypothetical protein AAFX93_04620 [Verrucomicrobiota bacterium]
MLEAVPYLFLFLFEIVVVIGSWLVGAALIKIVTVGKGRTGHLRDLKYNQRTKKAFKISEQEQQDFEAQQLAERTLYIGLASWIVPTLGLLAFLFYSLR